MASATRYSLGFDPGSQCTGWAIVKAQGDKTELELVGAIKPRKKRETGALGVSLMLHACSNWISNILLNYDRKIESIVVENQEVHFTGRFGRVHPNNIKHLGQIAGGILALCLERSEKKNTHFCFPEPKQWKGQVDKRIMQERICTNLGLRILNYKKDYVVPQVQSSKILSTVISSDWKEIVDAIGLALWGIRRKYEQYASYQKSLI